jgi:dGTPase
VSPEQAEGIEQIAAACGLIHDLGNPPFGHSGEEAIQTWFGDRLAGDVKFFAGFESVATAEQEQRMRQDFLRFEGNAQTIRIVSTLQVLTDFFGLNLTCGTMSAALKYTARSNDAGRDKGVHQKKKPGYFTSEDKLIEAVRSETGTGEARNPITYLVEAADDIVYATVDIEDGVKKGVVTWDNVEERLRAYVGGTDPILDKVLGRAAKKVNEAEVPIESGSERDEAMAQTFRTFAITEATLAVKRHFLEHYDAVMAGTFPDELISCPTISPLLKACKRTARQGIFCRDTEVLEREIAGREVIHKLMDRFWEGVKGYTPGADKENDFPAKIRSLISSNYRRVFAWSFERGLLPPDYLRMQLVTDYVCGMTDSFATRLYKKLTNG